MPLTLTAATLGVALAAQTPVGVIARVNGVPITTEQLQTALSQLIPQTTYHRSVNPGRLAELRQQALDTLIEDELRYAGAVELGLTVSDAEVDAGLERARSRRGSAEAFEAAREKAGVPPAEVRRAIRRALLIQKAYERAVKPRCEVTEDEAARFYAGNRQRFVTPAQRHVYLITIGVDRSASVADWTKGRHAAEDLRRRILAGESFEALAREHSTDPSREQGGDLGYVHAGRTITELEAALDRMRPGDITPVVQSIYGYHLVRLAAVRDPEQKSFKDVRDSLMASLADTKCESLQRQWIHDLRARSQIVLVDPRAAESVRPPGL